MALIKCPNCGHEISDKAEKCPHCGINLMEFLEEQKNIKEQEEKRKQEEREKKEREEKEKIESQIICPECKNSIDKGSSQYLWVVQMNWKIYRHPVMLVINSNRISDQKTLNKK